VPLPGANSLPVFSGDGRLLATTSDTQARLWDVGTMRERQFPVAFAYCAMIHLLKDGHIYVTEYHGEDGWLVDPTAITLWSFGPDLTVAGKPLRMPGARSAILSADGKFATGWQRNRETALLQLYELPTGRELGRLPTFMRGGTVGFSRDGTRMITDLLNLWDITTTPPRLVGADMHLRLDFSPDGRYVRAWPCETGPDQTEALLDAATFTKLPLRPDVSEVAFAPDGQTIAGNELVPPTMFQQYLAEWLPRLTRPSPFEALRVWTFPAWEDVATFPNVHQFAYFPDARSIALARQDGTIEIWDLPPRRPWWIDYGLAVVIALLLLLGARLLWRAIRKQPAPELAPC